MTIISISGRKESGKDTCAKELVDHYSFVLLKFANALKQIVADLLDITLEQLEQCKDSLFQTDLILTNIVINDLSSKLDMPCDVLHGRVFKSPRELLQVIGTDIIRKFNPEWHINKVAQIIQANPDIDYVIADARFPSEIAFIKDLMGLTLFVIRPYNKNISNHSSETSLNWTDFDKNEILINDKTRRALIESFNRKIESYIRIDYLFSDKQYKDEIYIASRMAKGKLTRNQSGKFIFYHDTITNLEYFVRMSNGYFKIKTFVNVNYIIINNVFIIENLKEWGVIVDSDTFNAPPEFVKDNSEFLDIWNSDENMTHII